MMAGDLLISTLKSREVRWVQFENKQVTAQVSLFKELDRRIRDVRVHQGNIFLLTDGTPGQLIQILPGEKHH